MLANKSTGAPGGPESAYTESEQALIELYGKDSPMWEGIGKDHEGEGAKETGVR
jgi:hypothetical protein